MWFLILRIWNRLHLRFYRLGEAMLDIELQKYLFDVQGYLVIENALTAEEVTELNDLFEAQELPPPDKSPRFGKAPDGSGFLAYGQPYCNLLDHPSILPVLRFRLGEAFRLDRLYGMQQKKGMKRGYLHADYGATAKHSGAKPGVFHHPLMHEIVNGFVVASWNLADTGPDHGGFCCIPGSHKSDYKLPQAIQDNIDAWPCVIRPKAPAGSVILFTEALTHGTSDWKAGHERRTLLYKYCVAHTAWKSDRVQPPKNIELTWRQKLLFRPPGSPLRYFPSLFEEPDPGNVH